MTDAGKPEVIRLAGGESVGESTNAAIDRAASYAGPAVVCVRTDVAANRAVPEELFMRFMEVYQGPMG